jgi:exopolyphosphatase/guanosine-5'-triphosphate,3'-diphosphate pyrophosphatase
VDPIVERLCSPEDRAMAERWGLAIRLGQRLSGGVADALVASHVAIDAANLTLGLEPDNLTLYGEAVERRLKILAAAFGRAPKLATRG